MSLDVYLTAEKPVIVEGTGVFIRENGQNRELSPKEVKKRYPEYEIKPYRETTDQVFHYNITHNLTTMAKKAGLYKALWYPDENGFISARQLIPVLQRGLSALQRTPEYYKDFNPPNGWGTYEGLVAFVKAYLAACKNYPDAKIETDV